MKTRYISKTSPVFCLVFVLMLLSGCLKSRFQVREDADDRDLTKPIPGQVQEVQPQGPHVVDELKSEITRLAGRIEDLERAKQDLSVTSAQKDELNKKLETRILELEQAQANMIEAIKKLQETKPVPPPVAEGPEAYDKARAHFDAGNYDAAIEGFSAYLRSPKAPKAEEATFLRAESYLVTKQFKKAIVDYSRFPEKYNRSKRMPTALFKIGQSFEALGMKEDAKGFYQELVDKYPKSTEAKRARAKLK